jgi:hypothetical protein
MSPPTPFTRVVDDGFALGKEPVLWCVLKNNLRIRGLTSDDNTLLSHHNKHSARVLIHMYISIQNAGVPVGALLHCSANHTFI